MLITANLNRFDNAPCQRSQYQNYSTYKAHYLAISDTSAWSAAVT